jgi:large subunit ribosomal protein L6
MSRVGMKKIIIPSDVKVTSESNKKPELNSGIQKVSFSGPKGTLTCIAPPLFFYVQEENKISVALQDQSLLKGTKKIRNPIASQWGTTTSLLQQAIKGVSSGFRIELELCGVGYRAEEKNGILNLTLGYSHPVKYISPFSDVLITAEKNSIVLSGCNANHVGIVAAQIKKLRKPIVYGPKGIYVKNEFRIKKEVKK